jgi:hypothetical protein
MLSKTGIALSAVIILSTALTASAAPRHHRLARGDGAIHNTVPGIITDRCLPTDSPCRTRPDGW